jgi:hypothetical protein
VLNIIICLIAYKNLENIYILIKDNPFDGVKKITKMKIFVAGLPYDLDDAEEIVKRIYTAKGLVAYTKRGDNNTITVMSTSKIGEPVVYEDEYAEPSASSKGAPTGTDAVKEAGEGTVDVPVNIINLGPKDPFFTPVSQESRTRSEKWDYTSWTPGLERMFAPTEAQTKWY